MDTFSKEKRKYCNALEIVSSNSTTETFLDVKIYVFKMMFSTFFHRHRSHDAMNANGQKLVGSTANNLPYVAIVLKSAGQHYNHGSGKIFDPYAAVALQMNFYKYTPQVYFPLYYSFDSGDNELDS